MTDTAAIARKFSKKERVGGTIKLKKAAVKQTKPGNWKDSEIVGTISIRLRVYPRLMMCCDFQTRKSQVLHRVIR